MQQNENSTFSYLRSIISLFFAILDCYSFNQFNFIGKATDIVRITAGVAGRDYWILDNSEFINNKRRTTRQPFQKWEFLFHPFPDLWRAREFDENEDTRYHIHSVSHNDNVTVFFENADKI